MRSLPVAAFAFGLVALLSLHCGGKVDGQPSTDCPSNMNQACPTNGTCTKHVNDCNGAYDVTCSCSSGGWLCPNLAGCPNPCANAKHGVACSSEGLFCKDAVQPNCDYPTNDGCTCQKGKFVCMATICGDPPPPVPACPPPSTIKEGGSCVGKATCSGILSCPKGGTVGVDYDCVNGRWQMWEYFQDPCETIDPDDGGVIIVDAGSKG